MDIEQLTKAQIVLLTLLVSFMTSIATGIVTVTLLAQAPPAVTQTINRIVERTVERVVPAETQNATAVTTENTIVVKETDLITDSIEKNAKSLVQVIKKNGNQDGTDALVGLGLFVSRGGLVATDSTLITEGSTYSVITDTGAIFTVVIQDAGEGKPTALLRVTSSEEDASFEAITFSNNLDVLKLGQTIISLSGGARTNVSIGIISSLDLVNVGNEGEERVDGIRTDIDEQRILFGSPLVDIFGEVIGIHTINAQGAETTANYTSIEVVRVQAAQFLEPASGE